MINIQMNNMLSFFPRPDVIVTLSTVGSKAKELVYLNLGKKHQLKIH